MCGRFYIDFARLDSDMARLLRGWNKDPQRPPFEEGEIAPTDMAPVIVTSRIGMTMRRMRWGFPLRKGKGVTFNARAETVLENSFFRKALLANPAVIPVSGFFEWREVPGRRKKAKYLFQAWGGTSLNLAGFYATFPMVGRRHEERFVVLTTRANSSVEPYHDRMPVLLRPEEREDWVRGGRLLEVLARTPFPLLARRMPDYAGRPPWGARDACCREIPLMLL